jgi:para-nitrobenzyl esterase
MTRSGAWVYGVVLVVGAAFTGSAGAAQHEPHAARPIGTESGRLQGVARDGVVAYLGVPYAAPPVGELRWRPPQSPPRWQGVRRANRFGDQCMQGQRPGAAASPMSEDCLYLNVWTPDRRAARKLPVMVWLHGGGFFAGSGSLPLYDGENLARRGVVVVTINYRLGRIGFFAHPALAKDNPADPIGNYGLLDQIAALKWVRRNVRAFGGDPANVTLFGQSAGGTAVSDLMASPLARGTFDKAIIESGIFSTPSTTLEEAEAASEAAAKSWGLTDPDAAALRAVPADEVLGRASGPAARAGPMIDGKVLPQDVAAAFEAGDIAHVPLIIGSNSYEAGFFRGMANGLSQRFASEWPQIEAVFDGYGTHQTAAIEGELATDMMITAPTWRAARAAARNGLPTYLYYFTYLRPSEQGHLPGPSHIDEVYAVFDHMSLVEKHPDAGTGRIVDEMESRWVRFARTGRPGDVSSPWPSVTPESLQLLEFTNDGPVVRSDFASRRLALAEQLSKAGQAPRRGP